MTGTQLTQTNYRYRPLLGREDARRMAKTLTQIRREQGESLPAVSTRRMQRMPASVLAGYAARPEHYRTAKLVEISDRRVVLTVGRVEVVA